MLVNVDGVVFPPSTSFSIEEYNLTKSGRVASGKMTMDLVAKKIKFLFAYDVLSGPNFDRISSVIYGNKMFFPITYTDNGRTHTKIVYSGAVKRERFRTDGIWYWKNVTFDLIEQ